MTTDAPGETCELSAHRTRTLWAVGILHAFTHLYAVALMPLYLLVQKDYRLESVGEATALMTIMAAAYFIPSYPMGILADRINRKQLLGWGLAVNALGFIALSLSSRYSCAVAAVLLAGFGGSFFHPAATAMVARLFPVGKGRALGWVGVGASVGFFVGPLYAGWRANTLETIVGAAAWRQPILELGILGLVATAAFFWLAENERTPGDISRGRREEVASVIAEEQRAAPEKLFPTPALWGFFVLAAFCFSLRDFAGTSMGSLGSLFLQNARGFDPGRTGIALGGLFLASAISNPVFGNLSDRGRKRWTASVLIGAAILVAVLPHTPAALTIPIFLLYGFFFLSSYPMVEAALMESVPDQVRGRIFGVWITIGGLIGNLSHWLVGARVKALGAAAHTLSAYYVLYGGTALLLLCSLGGLPCLEAIRRRESNVEGEPLPQESAIIPQ
jgi:MFS family permease